MNDKVFQIQSTEIILLNHLATLNISFPRSCIDFTPFIRSPLPTF